MSRGFIIIKDLQLFTTNYMVQMLFFSTLMLVNGQLRSCWAMESRINTTTATILSNSSRPSSRARAAEHGREPAMAPAAAARRRNVTGNILQLDPSQWQALVSLGVISTTSRGVDPCSNYIDNGEVVCSTGDSAVVRGPHVAAYKQVLSLRLQYCPDGAVLTAAAWRNLSSSLKALTLTECPAQLFQVPEPLALSLESFTCVACLQEGVPAAWLAQSFPNVVELSVSDVKVIHAGSAGAGSLHGILSGMKRLQRITMANTNLGGTLPASTTSWPSPATIFLLQLPNNQLHGSIPPSLGELSQLQSLDLSSNNLQGRLPEQLGRLGNLQYLSLASNQLTGKIPSLIFQNLTSLLYVDLSNNKFSGSIPAILAGMASLRYIDLRENALEGVIPFTEGYVRGLNSLKLGGNPGLCYNKSMISTFMEGSVEPCAWTYNGVSPPLTGPSEDDAALIANDLQHGPSKAVIVVALAVACTLGSIFTAILLSRSCCPSIKAR